MAACVGLTLRNPQRTLFLRGKGPIPHRPNPLQLRVSPRPLHVFEGAGDCPPGTWHCARVRGWGGSQAGAWCFQERLGRRSAAPRSTRSSAPTTALSLRRAPILGPQPLSGDCGMPPPPSSNGPRTRSGRLAVPQRLPQGVTRRLLWPLRYGVMSLPPLLPPPPPPLPAAVRMPACHSRRFKGERPIGAAKGKQSDTEALCQTPPGRGMPAEVRMPACHSRRFKGERPIGATKGKQSDTEALCQTPPGRGMPAEVRMPA